MSDAREKKSGSESIVDICTSFVTFSLCFPALRKAFHWFCQAAWDADRDAQYWLADCYDNGIGALPKT
eukprot:1090269-Amorphochlora_amoeboformis.AAC.1